MKLKETLLKLWQKFREKQSVPRQPEILNEIKRATQERRINITRHADEQLEEDNIEISALYFATLHGEVIENYSEDFPFPSCLELGSDQTGRPIHAV